MLPHMFTRCPDARDTSDENRSISRVDFIFSHRTAIMLAIPSLALLALNVGAFKAVLPRAGYSNPGATITKLVGCREYEDLVEGTRAGGVAVVWFSGQLCRACKAWAPRYERFAADWPHIEFAEVCLEDNHALVKALEIRVRRAHALPHAATLLTSRARTQ